MTSEVFGLIDANSFYASCEQVFRPDLWGKPVLVLSNNDACAVARSAQAKALGIPATAPVFAYQDLIEREQVTAFSSNYELYASFQKRILATLQSLVPEVEVYSIDENFLHLTQFAASDLVPFCQQIRKRVKRWTGIPSCVGLGPTKTLAKVANWLAKKRPEEGGVCDLRDPDARKELLATVPVEEIWGVGQATAQKLAEYEIATAADLAGFDPHRARRLLTVVGARIVYELRGVSCLPIELLEPQRKGMAVTRSFGHPVTAWQDMREALVTYATRASEKLREYHIAATHLTAFFHTSAFTEDPWYSDAASGRFPEATHNTAEIVRLTVVLGERIWRDGYRYAKAGVLLNALVRADQIQPSFFSAGDQERQRKLWQTVDDLNGKLCRGTVRPLSVGLHPNWALRTAHRSPRWTTNWQEIPKVKA